MAKIKICGLRRNEDIEIVNQYKPDYVGFIINFPKSFRSISIDELKVLTRKLDSSIQSVGVFVDEEMDQVIECFKYVDIVQLHGHESDGYIRTIQKYGPVIRAFEIRSIEDINKALSSPADYILLDQGKGSGQTFDWSLIPSITRPFFLAGGITLDNIEETKNIHPYGIDVRSSVETEKIKDALKVKEMIKRGRSI